MITATFSKFRNQARKYFDAVEKGESIEIYRHGRPSATLVPFKTRSLRRWKIAIPLKLSGGSLSQTILLDRQ